MLRSLTIENFRALQRFSMDGLGRINLLVGGNNGGKTSMLEAIHLLAAQKEADALWSILERRGELALRDFEGDAASEVEVRHLFPGHAIGSATQIMIKDDVTGRRFSARADASNLRLQWVGPDDVQLPVPLTRQGGLSLANAMLKTPPDEERFPLRFISTTSLSSAEVLPIFEAVVLSPEEDLLIEAMRTIEPSIERIAPVGRASARPRAGLHVKLTGQHQRVPLGSLGEGMWRLLVLALGLVKSRDGILLVDDIDTGLHYSVMTDMWALVKRTAERLNVQVFATTHSRDCYESLASIARPDVSEGSEISIQRIERGQDRAVAFTEQQIVIAARRGIEVR